MFGSSGKAPGAFPSACPKPDARSCGTHVADLDLCADQLYLHDLHALVPRIDCPGRGVKTVVVPWTTVGRTEFTERFERLASALLLEMSVAGDARRLAISWWNQVDAIALR